MSLRRRIFPEVLENLLTSVSGGVAAEPHPFPPPDNGRHCSTTCNVRRWQTWCRCTAAGTGSRTCFVRAWTTSCWMPRSPGR